MRATTDDLDLHIAGKRRWGDLFGERAKVFLAITAEKVTNEENECAAFLRVNVEGFEGDLFAFYVVQNIVFCLFEHAFSRQLVLWTVCFG